MNLKSSIFRQAQRNRSSHCGFFVSAKAQALNKHRKTFFKTIDKINIFAQCIPSPLTIVYEQRTIMTYNNAFV